MKRILLLAAAFAATPLAARAGDFDLVAQGFASQTDADVEFINADKFGNELSGVFTGVDLGAEYTFGDERGLMVGVHYFTTLDGEVTSEPVRNGNYLVHYTTLEGYSGWDVRAGWDFGALTFYAGYGELERDVTSYQSCPEDYQAVPFGFCGGGGNPAVGNAREGLRGGSPEEDTAELTRIGASWAITERVFANVDYAWAEFGQEVSPLDVIGEQPVDRTPHGPTAFAQDFNVLSLGLGVRF